MSYNFTTSTISRRTEVQAYRKTDSYRIRHPVRHEVRHDTDRIDHSTSTRQRTSFAIDTRMNPYETDVSASTLVVATTDDVLTHQHGVRIDVVEQ